MVTTRCTFRKARKREKAIIFELYKRVMGQFIARIWGWRQGWQRSDFNKHFDPDNITVAVMGNKLIGYCHVENQGPELFIRMLLLLPEYQGRGIGTRLVNAVIESARAQSKGVSLQVFKVNKRAIRFYRHHGFRVAGTTPAGFTMELDPGSRRRLKRRG